MRVVLGSFLSLSLLLNLVGCNYDLACKTYYRQSRSLYRACLTGAEESAPAIFEAKGDASQCVQRKYCGRYEGADYQDLREACKLACSKMIDALRIDEYQLEMRKQGASCHSGAGAWLCL